MTTESTDGVQLAATLDGIRRELSRLNERVTALEASAPPLRLVTPESRSLLPTHVPIHAAGELSEELILVLGAAVAAYLGKKAHVRQVRLIGTLPWAQQGRVTIQASHTVRSRTGRRES